MSPSDTDPVRLLGLGIYDVNELAHLVMRAPEDISTWSRPAKTPTRSQAELPALLHPRGRKLFSFHDLVTAWVVAELSRRRVRLATIRQAALYVGDRLHVDPKSDWPLARAAGLDLLKTVGRDVYFDGEDNAVDAGRGGQQAFMAIVQPLMRHIEFGPEGLATRWRPREGVLVDPGVQAGAPCIERTRIETYMIAELVDAGEDPADIAADYELDLAAVYGAVAFEHQLVA